VDENLPTKIDLRVYADTIVLAAETSFDLLEKAFQNTTDEDGESNEVWVSELVSAAQSYLDALRRFIWD
jgi:hypothetical protein